MLNSVRHGLIAFAAAIASGATAYAAHGSPEVAVIGVGFLAAIFGIAGALAHQEA